ncbi:MAG: asparagine synthase (glutamine-hydrolyzing) [Verrucomicrobiota bacterium]
MCGIFGFSGFEEERLLERMAEAMVHRGPDGEGYFRAAGFQMGMRRLSIIDLEGGVQPIYNEDRSIAVCYNGEIYNYIELRDELIKRGHEFRTQSDTEVVVHAYEEWGLDCLERFNGMFAFALYDEPRERVFLARDRCGQKPLYWWNRNGRFVFASEIKSILKSACVSAECNVGAIDAYLGLRNVPEPATMFKDIYTLPAAHFMLIEKGAVREPQRYWDIKLSDGGGYRNDDEYLEELEAEFHKAVSIAMRSDVPVGAYLSAGVDSSLIVAEMAKLSNRVNTFSIGFDSPIDETKDAAETANLLGTKHHEIQCRPQDFELLPKIVYHMDRPVGDALIIAFYRLAEETSRDLKVVLSGEGADEMYGGYSFHKVIQLVEKYSRMVPGILHQGLAMPALQALPVGALNKFFEFPAYLGTRGKARLLDFLGNYSTRDLATNVVALRTLWDLNERGSLYSERFKSNACQDWIPRVRDSGGPFFDRMLKLQYDEWLQDWALIRQDKNTMAHSLEIRLPFLDHNLIEQAFRMPPRLKALGFKDKIVERRLAQKVLPSEVTNRAKNPFFMPMEYFFEHPQVGELIKMTLNEAQVRRRGYFDPKRIAWLLEKMETREFVYLKQVMSLVILELWHLIFIDKQKLW